MNPINPRLILVGLLNGSTQVFADVSQTADGGYCGPVRVQLGTSSYQTMLGCAGTAYPTYQTFGPGSSIEVMQPEALALVAATQAAGDMATVIAAYL